MMLMMFAIGVWVGVVVPIVYQWLMRGYRGTWKCTTCHQVYTLPKDGDE